MFYRGCLTLNLSTKRRVEKLAPNSRTLCVSGSLELKPVKVSASFPGRLRGVQNFSEVFGTFQNFSELSRVWFSAGVCKS